MSTVTSSDVMIRAENLGKHYRLGETVDLKRTFRELLSGLPGHLARRMTRTDVRDSEWFWALKGIDLEIRRGEAVGIIGRNGAGKSTLLKILSRITAPTTGRIEIHGRVGSLLEIGTGFHPELTGRENIYLNGSILGMRKHEIARKFDEIVDFAGTEMFLDTPVKRYSSGMRVRLGFAVAAHLEPEILIVDEVLSVGDAEFRKKCMGKMEHVTGEGRTVLFVSHNMAAVRNLCSKAILLGQGMLEMTGPTPETITSYLNSINNSRGNGDGFFCHNKELEITLENILILNGDGETLSSSICGNSVVIRLIINTEHDWKNILTSISVHSSSGERICIFHSGSMAKSMKLYKPKTFLDCSIPRIPLMPDTYRLDVKLVVNGQSAFHLHNIFEFNIAAGDYFGSGNLPDQAWGGQVLVDHSWNSTRSRVSGKE
jgi:lipopolysaccharide transport system ATP-binding protein